MNKFYRVVAGQKLFCEEDGTLLKDSDGHYLRVKDEEDVDEDELEEVEPEEEPSEEVETMLNEAREQVAEKAEEDMKEAKTKAYNDVEELFSAFSAGAEEKKAEIANADGGARNKLFDPENVRNQMKAFNEGKSSSVAFEIADPENAKSLLEGDSRQKATSRGDLTGDVIEGTRVPEVTRDPVRDTFVESIADVTPNMQSEFLGYVEATNESGAPATTAELAQAPEKDFTFEEFKAYLKKIMVTNKHSVELLQDSQQLVSAIQTWLNQDVNIETDEQLLNGDGTGSNLEGVFTVATAVTDASLGSKEVETPNLYDVLRVSMTQIMTAGKGQYRPTHVLLNSEDSDELDLTKDADGRYILPPFISEDGTRIKGARLIENTGVPQGEFLVGDFSKLHVGTKGGVQIEMTDSDGDDFGKDILTVKLRRRVASYVRNNDSGAFQTGNISNVKAALNPNS